MRLPDSTFPSQSKTLNGLDRSRRLIKSGDFQRIKTSGDRFALGCLLANWLVVKDTEPALSRLGVVTSRKIGNAVQRSRARRLIREVFRKNQRLLLQPLELVLVARRSIQGMSYQGVERDFMRLCKKNGLLRQDASLHRKSD